MDSLTPLGPEVKFIQRACVVLLKNRSLLKCQRFFRTSSLDLLSGPNLAPGDTCFFKSGQLEGSNHFESEAAELLQRPHPRCWLELAGCPGGPEAEGWTWRSSQLTK